jgi:uncharacterized protein YjbI with pentapeptide repeats
VFGATALLLCAASAAFAAPRFRAERPRPTRVGTCVLVVKATCRGVDLRGAELFAKVLAHADLRGARLQGANLATANLHGADLRGASLAPGPPPRQGRLPGQPTRLQLADLRGAQLGGADLRRVLATGANLRGARLVRARLMGAGLANANLRGAMLVDADLRKADLRHASLVGADLRFAELRQADLRGADLRGARLRGADLLRADLAGAALTRRQLSKARLLCETVSTRGPLVNRDCARLHVEPHPSIASRLRPRTARHRPKLPRFVVPVGPRLAGPRKTAHAPAGPRRTAHTSNTCAPGNGPECAYWYLAGYQFPKVQATNGDFYMTDMDWTNLEEADFQGSFIAVAQFDGANLSHANFSYTTQGLEPSTDASSNFNYANLEGIDFEGSDLRGDQFLDANLRGANLRNTNLDYANFDGANLDGANLEGAYMEGTQFDMASVEEANFLGSFAFQANFANANLTNSLMGVYMEGAPVGGFTGQQGSLNLDQAGWTCGTTLPSGTVDNDDCTFTFKLLGEFLAGVAESVSGFSFGTVSSSALTAGVRAALEDTTESLGGTAVKLANWTLYDGTTSALKEIVSDSPTLGALGTNVLPAVKLIGVKLASVIWKIEAPEGLMSLPIVREYFAHHPSTQSSQTVYSPISAWESEWAESLYRYWSTKPAGREYANAAGCTEGEPPQCEATTYPVRIPNPPTAEVAPLASSGEPVAGEFPSFEAPPEAPMGAEEAAAAEEGCFFCGGFFP